MLAPLGLKLQRVEGRIYSVVPQAGPDDSRATAAAPRQQARAMKRSPTSSSPPAATRSPSDVPEVHTFLSQQEVDALPRLADDALKAVHRLPGAASNGLAGLAHMRGGDTNETLVMLDGLPLYEPFHLQAAAESVQRARRAHRRAGSTCYAGGFTAEYGDRMSAIIDAPLAAPRQRTRTTNSG